LLVEAIASEACQKQRRSRPRGGCAPTLGDGDLLAYFKAQGLSIAHHPYEDPTHKHTPPTQARKTHERIRSEALHSYDDLPKPVLIQCSAGEDRSAPIAAYIYAERA